MISEALVFKALLAAGVLALAAGAASAASVTLQQGADGYAGCTTRTVWGKGARKVDGDTRLYLRGSKNRFVVKFGLPTKLADRKLARARLVLFLPSAKTPNVFTELFCHEITAAGDRPTIDGKTDYDNGRRAGAVDSVELFAPPGQYWKNYPWLPLGVPKGGKQIEFNVTPLVEKWLKQPAANHGVTIVPTDCPDKRFPSTWEIDIPSATYAGKAEHRPRLILEFAPLAEQYKVGMTHSMRRILDRSTRFAYRGEYGTQYKMSMAANEFEGFQVVVYPMLEDLKNVRFTWTDLAGPDGKSVPAADVEYFVEDYYRVRANWKTRDVFFRMKLYETVDPLVPAKPVTVRRHMNTAFYFVVRTRPETPAGTYKGTVTVHADNAKATRLSLAVKVWPYKIPEKWNFHTMGQFVWDNCRRFHGKDWNAKLQRKYYDWLMDHRFSPTEQYSQRLSPRQDMKHCLDRGMNTVYLYSVHGKRDKPTKAMMDRIKPDYEKVKKLGALDHALVYIGDETSNWPVMHKWANMVHAHLPGALVMIGGSFPRKELTGYIDIYDPQIGGRSKTFSLQEASAGKIAKSQARGEEFYWYVAAGPAYPFPNVQVEYPVSDSRALFWMTWKYGVTGFEYYCYNIWNHNYSADPAKRYPNSKWKADGWQRGWPSNGDGMLFYPGPISSFRFEAIRDGIEDWESLMVLRDCIEAVRNRKNAARYRELIAEAKKLLAVRPEIVKGFQEFTRDPDLLLAEREKLGELIASFMKVVPKLLKWNPDALSLARAAEVRIARGTALRRKMLRERHLKACEALGLEPLSQGKWDALWPRRVLFSQDFEGPPVKHAEWAGEIVTDNLPAGSKRALAGEAGNKYFARRVRVGIYYDHARAATTTWVKFKYFINKNEPIGVFVFDLTQRDNWAGTIADPVVGKWTEATLNVTRDFRKKGAGSAKFRAGDALDDVFVHAGKPGDEELKLIVDDVQLIGLD